MIVFERGELLYICNFSPNSYNQYLIGTEWESPHMVLYETDDEKFDGLQRMNDVHNKWIDIQKGTKQHNRPNSLFINVPSYCAIVLVAYENATKHDELQLQMPELDMTMKYFNKSLVSEVKSDEKVEEVVVGLVSNIMKDVVEAQEDEIDVVEIKEVEEITKEIEEIEKKVDEIIVKDEVEIKTKDETLEKEEKVETVVETENKTVEVVKEPIVEEAKEEEKPTEEVKVAPVESVKIETTEECKSEPVEEIKEIKPVDKVDKKAGKKGKKTKKSVFGKA